MTLTDFIRAMPKVELHVHLEGAIQPETVLELARRNNIQLPADSVAGIHKWYTFTDFPHFIQVYLKVSECIRTPEDIEFVAREFLKGQAAQNIRYTEATYTPHTHYMQKGLAFEDQLAALNRARAWAENELGVAMGIITDISRNVTPENGLMTAEWAISGMNAGVIALGLGGSEIGHPPEKHAAAFGLAHKAGLPVILHAGETEGAASIWGALEQGTLRIGHGVRCMEDPALVAELRRRQIPLEVSPTSNICLKVFPSLKEHALPKLLEEGLYVTINSDDPPMFNTSLTEDYIAIAETFGFEADRLQQFVMDALAVSLLPEDKKAALKLEFETKFDQLRTKELS